MRLLRVITITALAVWGVAQAADDRNVAPAQTSVEQSQSELQVGTPAQVSGKIVSIHNVSLVGLSDPHVLVKLESSPGNVDIVDLGSATDLKNNGIEPREGQQLWIDGRVGKINDKPLVVAERLSESKLVFINRQAPLREESTKHAEARQADGQRNEATNVSVREPRTESAEADQPARSIVGTVIHTRRIDIEGEPAQHIFAKVKTDNGIAVLDLGTCSTMPASLDLTEGNTIAASGMTGRLNGKPIIIVESVGNMNGIQRANAPEALPTANTPSTK